MARYEDGLGTDSEDGSSETPQSARRLSRAILVLGLGGLILLGTYLFLHWPPAHGLRIAGLMLPLAVGLWAGVALVRHQKGGLGLLVILTGAALGWLGWWFVPTTKGLSFWAAQHERDRLLGELRALPIGVAAGYRQNLAKRAELLTQFPEFRTKLEEAESAWVEQSRQQWMAELRQLPACAVPAFRALNVQYRELVDARLTAAEQEWVARSQAQWQREVTATKAGDVAAFESWRSTYEPFVNARLQAAELAWLERTYQELPPGDFHTAGRVRTLVRPNLGWDAKWRGWEARWIERAVDAACKAAEALLNADALEASARLQRLAQDVKAVGEYPDQQRRILAMRHKAASAHLQAARQQARGLIAADRFQAAAQAADELATKIEPEARAVGLQEDLRKYCESCRFLADLARQAGKSDPWP
jgi:hypothetical protein